MLLKRRQPDPPATALNKVCSIRTSIGVYTEFGMDPVDELPKAAVLRIFRTALYVRLSIMDTRDRKDSESLQTQIDYLCGYIAKHPDLELYDCYRDNGETGTNFAEVR